MALQRPVADGADVVGDKTKVFISYSRNDGAFAERLRDALITRGFEAYLDKHDIAPGEPWQERLSGLITSADTVVFCLSPSFVASEICDWEVNEGERLGKRLLPVVAAATPNDAVPQRLKRLNYIFMRDEAEFADGLEQLVTALDTDIAWIRAHTRLGERAMEWLRAGKTEALLLRGDAISRAEAWIAARPREAPDITEEIAAYIAGSRQAATEREARARRRGRIITGTSLTAAMVMGVLGWLMFGQWQEGLRRESLSLGDFAQQHVAAGDAVTGRLLALEGLRDEQADSLTQRWRPYVPEAELALDATGQPGLWHDAVFIYRSSANSSIAAFDGDAPVSVAAVQFTLKGGLLAAYSWDGIVSLEDVTTGRRLSELRGHCGSGNTDGKLCGVSPVAFSTDGTRLATASSSNNADNTVQIWDVGTGKKIATLRGHEDPVASVTFSPDGKRIATGAYDSTARIWDAATGTPLAVLRRHTGPITGIAYSRDGSRLATASSDTAAIIWDTVTGKLLVVLPGHEKSLNSIAFSPDGARLATASDDGTARLWNVATGKVFAVLRGHRESVTAITFSPGNTRLATVSADGTGRIWNAATGDPLAVLEGHCVPMAVDVEENCAANIVAFSRDGTRLATASSEGTIRIWAPANSYQVAQLQGHCRPGTLEPTFASEYGCDMDGLAFSPDGKFVATAAADKTARIWSVSDGKQTAVLRGHKKPVWDVAYSPDGRRLATISEDDTLKIWDVATATEISTISGVVCPTGSGDSTDTFTCTMSDKPGVAFSPDGRLLVTASANHAAKLWDVASGSEVGALRGHIKDVIRVTFSPDGSLIATSSEDYTARLWDVKTRQELSVLRGHTRYVHSVAFSPDGALLATTAWDDTTRIWNVANGKEIAILGGHCPRGTFDQNWGCGINDAVFSPDGRLLATAAADETVRVWDLSRRKALAVLRGHCAPVNLAAAGNCEVSRVAFSPDGRVIATTSNDGTARLWAIPPPIRDQIDTAKSKLTRCLTPGQRELFHLSPTPPQWCFKRRLWPYHDRLPPPDWITRQASSMRQKLASWIGPKSGSSRWLARQDWLHSANEFFERGHAELKNKKYNRAAALYKRAKARVPEFAANISPHLREIERQKQVAKLQTAAWAEQNYLSLAARVVTKAVAVAKDKEYDGAVAAFTSVIDWARGQDGKAPNFSRFIGTKAFISFNRKRIGKRTLLARALFGRGEAHYNGRKYAKAIPDYGDAKALGHKNAAKSLWYAKVRLSRQAQRDGRLIEALLIALPNYLAVEPKVRISIGLTSLRRVTWTISYPIGILHADLAIKASPTPIVTDCDRLASRNIDPFRIAPAIHYRDLDADQTIAACTKTIEQDPKQPRYFVNRARGYAKKARKAKDKRLKAAQFALMHADLKAAMTMDTGPVNGYPIAFRFLGKAYVKGWGVKKNRKRGAELYVEALNRIVHCCWLPVARHLLSSKKKHDPKTVRRVVHELTRWAVALGTVGAQELLDELYVNGMLIRPEQSTAIAKATFTDAPPWLKPRD